MPIDTNIGNLNLNITEMLNLTDLRVDFKYNAAHSLAELSSEGPCLMLPTHSKALVRTGRNKKLFKKKTNNLSKSAAGHVKKERVGRSHGNKRLHVLLLVTCLMRFSL